MATYEMEAHSSKMAKVHIFRNNVKDEGRLYDGDVAQLYASLGAIGVGPNEIDLHKDKTAGEIEAIFKQMATENYDTYNCVIIVFFGVGDYGVIKSSDKQNLQLESVIRYLWADSCPSLAGKPKIFLNQACNDRRYFMVDGYDGPGDAPQRMPAQSDLLSVWSLLPVNLQKPEHANKVGSLFFKYLCEELKKSKAAVKESTEKPWYFEEEDKIDFLKLITHVSGLVADDMPDLQFKDSGKRNRNLLEHRIDDMPIPCTVSMLTKKLLFPVKV